MAIPHKPGGDVFELMRAIWALDHALQSRSKAMGKAIGITGPQRFVLRVVQLQPGISSGELANWLHLHPSTLTGVLQRLEQRGMLTRRPDPEDARRALIALTLKGKKLLAHKQSTVEAVVRRALARETHGAVAAACEVLHRITRELDHAAPP